MSSFNKNTNPFEEHTGSMKLTNVTNMTVVLAFLILVLLVIVEAKLVGAALVVATFASLGVLYAIFNNPKVGIYLIIVMSFFVIGFTRYVNITWGLSIDFLLVLIYLALFFKSFGQKIPWHKAKSSLTWLVLIWMGYIFLELGNPEVVSYQAWFYAMRGLGLYQAMLIPLVFILYDKQKDLNTFFVLWGILSLLGTLKGLMQFTIGLDPFEEIWLYTANNSKTHLLFGKLRIFSFYSDAGQFGAAQGHAGLLFGILAFSRKINFRTRTFYLIVALAGLFGLVISGTRGALAVPAMGAIMFLILRKNIAIIIAGGLFLIATYVFFAHTTIGQGNAEIRRMRTAFNPNNASYQVRLANQRKLKGYLATRPFGGGVGATGNWGKRFAPNSFLGNTPTDSWYVAIWSDTGQIGLTYYLGMIFFVLITGVYNVMVRIRDPELKIQITALVCGMAGIMAASYGNGVFGQMPTGIIMSLTMVYIFRSPHWETEELKEIETVTT